MSDELSSRLARVEANLETHREAFGKFEQRVEGKLDTLLAHYHLQRGMVKVGHAISGMAGGAIAAFMTWYASRGN